MASRLRSVLGESSKLEWWHCQARWVWETSARYDLLLVVLVWPVIQRDHQCNISLLWLDDPVGWYPTLMSGYPCGDEADLPLSLSIQTTDQPISISLPESLALTAPVHSHSRYVVLVNMQQAILQATNSQEYRELKWTKSKIVMPDIVWWKEPMLAEELCSYWQMVREKKYKFLQDENKLGRTKCQINLKVMVWMSRIEDWSICYIEFLVCNWIFVDHISNMPFLSDWNNNSFHAIAYHMQSFMLIRTPFQLQYILFPHHIMESIPLMDHEHPLVYQVGSHFWIFCWQLKVISFVQFLFLLSVLLLLFPSNILTCSLPSLGLLWPVVLSNLCCWITTVCAGVLLNVQWSSTTSSAECMCLSNRQYHPRSPWSYLLTLLWRFPKLDVPFAVELLALFLFHPSSCRSRDCAVSWVGYRSNVLILTVALCLRLVLCYSNAFSREMKSAAGRNQPGGSLTPRWNPRIA